MTSPPNCAGELVAARRRDGVDHHERFRRPEADPDPDHGPRLERASADRGPRAAAWYVRCPAPSTSGCPRAARSPSSKCMLDRALAGSLGITVGQVAQALRPRSPASTSATGSIPRRDARRHRALRAGGAQRAGRPLDRCRSSCPDRGQVRHVPLGQLATIRPGVGPARIEHLDRERVVTVQANTRTGRCPR